jgi:hypothetical protein
MHIWFVCICLNDNFFFFFLLEFFVMIIVYRLLRMNRLVLHRNWWLLIFWIINYENGKVNGGRMEFMIFFVFVYLFACYLFCLFIVVIKHTYVSLCFLSFLHILIIFGVVRSHFYVLLKVCRFL